MKYVIILLKVTFVVTRDPKAMALGLFVNLVKRLYLRSRTVRKGMSYRIC